MSTMDGRFAFLVEYQDGARLSERDLYWDDVPQEEPITALCLMDHLTGEELLRLQGFSRYCFANEGAAAVQVDEHGKVVATGDHVFTGKVLVGIHANGSAELVRVNLLGKRTHEHILTTASELPFAARSYRDGATECPGST